MLNPSKMPVIGFIVQALDQRQTDAFKAYSEHAPQDACGRHMVDGLHSLQVQGVEQENDKALKEDRKRGFRVSCKMAHGRHRAAPARTCRLPERARLFASACQREAAALPGLASLC